MKLYSTNNPKDTVDFRTAVLQGLASDGGLFMPTKIPKLPSKFFKNIHKLSFREIAFEVSKNLLDNEIPDKDLKKIIQKSLTFDAPLVQLAPNLYTLELFHGPTLAFKDFGARFMAQTMSYLIKNSKQKITILAATSGDTGSAVASGFFKTKNINVILLYPSKKVSKIQEKQLTTMGHNITALEIKGTFDDCQKLVKAAFVDKDLRATLKAKNTSLASANSINIARLIPQSFYYFYAYAQLAKIQHSLKLHKPKHSTNFTLSYLTKNHLIAPIFSVPSGNFGNLTAGLLAKKMGLPVTKFIAATNANNTFPKYLETGTFKAKPSVKTISNAMDVGNPSNFARIEALYACPSEPANIKTLAEIRESLANLRNDIWSASFSDQETKSALKELYKKYNYIADPHGAVGYLGLSTFTDKEVCTCTNQNNKMNFANLSCIFLETAHPAKFLDIVEPIIKTPIKIPPRLAVYLKKRKKSTKLTANYESFKKFLMS